MHPAMLSRLSHFYEFMMAKSIPAGKRDSQIM
jgi:hypothetical protein